MFLFLLVELKHLVSMIFSYGLWKLPEDLQAERDRTLYEEGD